MIYTDRLSPFVWHMQIHGHEFGVRWYGLAYLLGFFLMYLFYRQAALRAMVPGFTLEDVDSLALRIVLGVMIGGRLGFVIQHPVRLIHDPLFLIAIWQGGMAYFGGLAGVILAIWTYSRQHKIGFLALTDVCAIPTPLALGIGRLANFVNGELYGRPTHAGWGVIFPRVDLQPRHPSQLYEAASHLLLFIILFALYNWRRGKIRPGGLSFLFLAGYGVLRFITDFWRQDDVYWGPFSDGQWFSLGIAVGGLIALYVWSRYTARAQSTPAPTTNEKRGETAPGSELR